MLLRAWSPSSSWLHPCFFYPPCSGLILLKETICPDCSSIHHTTHHHICQQAVSDNDQRHWWSIHLQPFCAKVDYQLVQATWLLDRVSEYRNTESFLNSLSLSCSFVVQCTCGIGNNEDIALIKDLVAGVPGFLEFRDELIRFGQRKTIILVKDNALEATSFQLVKVDMWYIWNCDMWTYEWRLC